MAPRVGKRFLSSMSNQANVRHSSTALQGRRIAVTRSQDRSGRLVELLRAAGASVIELPVARYEPPESWAPVDAALESLPSFSWIAFTSVNGVEYTVNHAKKLSRTLLGPAVAAIGEATAAALKNCGITVDLIPSSYDAESLAQELDSRSYDQATKKIVLFQADNARSVLKKSLEKYGWTVITATAYRSIALPIPRELCEPGFDAVTFASAATVERFIGGIGHDRVQDLEKSGCRWYAIGPQTAAAIRDAHLTLTGIAESATIESLVDKVVQDFGVSEL